MNYKGNGQLTLSERIAIEIGICNKESFKKIGIRLSRHPSTISQEIKKNRTYIIGIYPMNNDCRLARKCRERHICHNNHCNDKCVLCTRKDCHKYCKKYVSVKCNKFNSIPYVCNTCYEKKLCNKDRYLYSAKYADAVVTRRRSETRSGIRISEENMNKLDKLVTRLIKKGQPLTHIYAEHKQEMPISLRSLYNYIDTGQMTVRNIDLRRKTSYRKRKVPHKKASWGFKNLEYRKGRTYEDYERYMKNSNEMIVTEMDTVKGLRESGKRLLTMILRKNSIMLLFLLPDGKAESVIRVFDYLEAGLGTDIFKRLFPVILTDNGSEFKKAEFLSLDVDGNSRTRVFYCDPMASWQKPHIEKNHQYIRYAVPKRKSLNAYTQEDMTLLMNHINSTKRPGLKNRSPYELIGENDKDMNLLMRLLKMHLIPPDEVHLKPDLFLKK